MVKSELHILPLLEECETIGLPGNEIRVLAGSLIFTSKLLAMMGVEVSDPGRASPNGMCRRLTWHLDLRPGSFKGIFLFTSFQEEAC